MRGVVIIPFVDCREMTAHALHDARLQLEGSADVLLIDQGSGEEVRHWSERAAQHEVGGIRLWSHHPPLPSLAATWNRALNYAWDCGYADAMVWNNDIRVRPAMYADLREVASAYGLEFVTPVNCRDQADPGIWQKPLTPAELTVDLGGPDFSCFLITRACHEAFRFDERFHPAYHEDSDMHRRMWLSGWGKRIAGCTLPYLHYGSATIKRSDEAGVAFAPQFAACRARYVAKWGGEPHHERRITPDSPESLDDVGTPGGYLDIPPPEYLNGQN